jgi:hypothetical protein
MQGCKMENKEIPDTSEDSRVPSSIGSSEPDDGPLPEKEQGDGPNLTRPCNPGNGDNKRTSESLDILGAGSPYNSK